jgi:hypothetical protein
VTGGGGPRSSRNSETKGLGGLVIGLIVVC